MTETLIRQVLHRAIGDVLEKMFFVAPLEEASLPEPSRTGDEIAIRLTFLGDPPGTLTLRVTHVSAGQIAADFLGTDYAEVSSQQTSEVIRELANMICGSVLSRLESSSTFQLGPPEVVPAEDDPAQTESGLGLAYELPDGRLTVLLKLGTSQCPEPAEFAY